MRRICQTLDLKQDPKLIEEYEYWHEPKNIWPQVIAGIKEVGIINMEIYRSGTKLFMIIDLPDDFNWNEQMQKLSQLPLQKEWEELMAKFQDIPNDNEPGLTSFLPSDQKWRGLTPLFQLKIN